MTLYPWAGGAHHSSARFMLLNQQVLAHWVFLHIQILVELRLTDLPGVEQRMVRHNPIEFLLEIIGELLVCRPRVAVLRVSDVTDYNSPLSIPLFPLVVGCGRAGGSGQPFAR